MNVPLEISYRHVDKTEALESLIREKVDKLEDVCDHISSCRIAIEKPHEHPSSGTPYRVRIDLRVPPGHELAVDKSPDQGTQYEPLETLIREAFDAARRQLIELNERQHSEVKHHEDQSMGAIVTTLFPEDNYGFIKTLDGREVYFHRNSVLNNDFDRLEIGTGVRMFVTEGEKGPQASTVQIVNKPGVRASKVDEEEEEIAPPAGW
ncbi:MAG TPA: HPF/RaiA family ribosome-associated protein [Elainellaceae cyanobacterium]